MRFFSNRKLSQSTIKKLRKEIDNGERFTVEKIIEKFFKPKNSFHFYLARERATAWLCQITRQINKGGHMFGRVNEKGEYGFPANEEEARYIAIRGYMLTKGNWITSMRKIQNGQSEKLLVAKTESLQYLNPIKQLP